jgi:hypothetical protein
MRARAGTVKYRPAPGSRLNAEMAELVGREMDRLHRKYGDVTAEMLLDAARPTTSPIHGLFEWDDQAAAERHRLSLAGALIRAVRVVIQPTSGKGKAINARAYVSVTRDGGERSYQPLAAVLSRPEWKRQMLEEALAALEALQKKFSDLEVLDELWSALLRVKKKRA